MQFFSPFSLHILATFFALCAALPAERRQCTIGKRYITARDTPCTTDQDCSAFRPSGVCCTQDVIDNDPFVLCAQSDVGKSSNSFIGFLAMRLTICTSSSTLQVFAYDKMALAARRKWKPDAFEVGFHAFRLQSDSVDKKFCIGRDLTTSTHLQLSVDEVCLML